MKKILAAFNSFKGVMSAAELCRQMAELLNNKVHVLQFPVSDGGDGFLEMLENTYLLERKVYSISSFYEDEIIKVPVLINSKSKTVYIETAYAVGLKLVPVQKRNPKNYNTKNLGTLVNAIIKKEKPEKIILGIGGTATMDMGIGFLEAFGLSLLDDEGASIKAIPANFNKVKDIIWEHGAFFPAVECVIDVDNPLLGEEGGLRTYGGQKGASPEEIKEIEAGAENLLGLLASGGIYDGRRFLPGAGGGLAAGLSLFLNAGITSSETFLRDNSVLGGLIEEAGFIITGEGSFDSQSLHKKAPSLIIDMVKDSGKKVFLCCGVIDGAVKNRLPDYVIPVELSGYFGSVEASIENIEEGLKKASEEILKELNC